MRRTFFLVVAVLAIGCSKQKTAAVSTPAPAERQPAPAAPPPAAATTPSVAVADDLVKQCQLRFSDPALAPKFDYDRAELLPEDRDVLEQIATCVTTGPLAGRAVTLTGRADPRGTAEYNLGLGARRADTVSAYLQRLGVPAARLQRTTRGALDASGADEASWRVDRRVDVTLAN
jgi:outer membrane protein OmpA-like peptidoglycan-associated protein